MNDAKFREKAALFEKYGIALSADFAAKLQTYAEMMIEESAVQNITAVTDPDAIWVRHFLDAARLLQYIPPDCRRIIDIGTGGGIPGIPLAIRLSSDTQTLLLDSELRKIEFCARAVDALGVNAEAKCARAEELAHDPAYRETFDAAVSRAMTNGSVLCEMAIPFLKVGGKLLAMKGKNYSDETEGFARAAKVLGAHVSDVERYSVEGEEKHLIIVQKDRETPMQYPRRFAKIKRSPL